LIKAGNITKNIKKADKILIICDFDGTLSTTDVGYEIIVKFAGSGWEKIDRDYCEGNIGSRDAYTKIAALFHASRKEMVMYALEHGHLDPTFHEFYGFCLHNNIDVKIVSDGLDFYIKAILEKNNLQEIQFFSNVARFHNNGNVTIEFPGSNDTCNECGNCKSNILEQYRLTYDSIIYIGNGYSDVCPAQKADMVFAKDILYEKCLENGRDCIHYENFDDIREYLERSFPFFLSGGARD